MLRTNNSPKCQPCVLAKYGWLVVLGAVFVHFAVGQLGWSQTPSGDKPLQGNVSHSRLAERGIVGLDLTIRPNRYPVVAQVFPGTPAATAGFRKSMVILAVDGQSLLGLTRTQVDVAISDRPGDRVQFLVDNGEANQPRVLMLTVAGLSDLAPSDRQHF